jgi:hypothetical protein
MNGQSNEGNGASMGTFRRVEGEQAGPRALGILVPPGRRTFVILRPRALSCDLVLLREAAGTAFCDLTHDEASAAAQALWRALRDGAVTVEIRPDAAGCSVVASIGTFALLACPREPGQPYRPLAAAEPEARRLGDALTAVLVPPEEGEQELYFNVRFFERDSAAGG